MVAKIRGGGNEGLLDVWRGLGLEIGLRQRGLVCAKGMSLEVLGHSGLESNLEEGSGIRNMSVGKQQRQHWIS